MKNDITPHIKTASEHIRLSEAERAHMAHVIHEYMVWKPLPTPASPRTFLAHWSAFAHRPLALALLFLVIFSGGISYAAESALPGDALYAVKTKVNEPLQVALASSPEAKANVQMQLAERRIEEAATLAADGRLDSETQDALATSFQAHAQSATDEVAAIDENDSPAAAEISSRFETRLAAHEAVLAQVRGGDAAANDLFTTAIRGAGRAVADIRARAEERVAVSAPASVATTMALAMDAAPQMAMMAAKAGPAPTAKAVATTATESSGAYDAKAALRMQSAAETQLKTVQKKFKSVRSKLDDADRADTATQLADAENLIDEGRAFLTDEAYAHAYHSFQESLVITEKLGVVLNATTTLKKATSQAEADERFRASVEARVEARGTPQAGTMQESTRFTSQEEMDADTGHDAPLIPPPLQIFHFDDTPNKDAGASIDTLNVSL